MNFSQKRLLERALKSCEFRVGSNTCYVLYVVVFLSYDAAV